MYFLKSGLLHEVLAILLIIVSWWSWLLKIWRISRLQPWCDKLLQEFSRCTLCRDYHQGIMPLLTHRNKERHALQWGVTFSQVVWLVGCWLISASHKKIHKLRKKGKVTSLYMYICLRGIWAEAWKKACNHTYLNKKLKEREESVLLRN
jgi:hypothetical protein